MESPTWVRSISNWPQYLSIYLKQLHLYTTGGLTISLYNRLLKIRLSSSSSDQVVKSLIFCFVHLVRSPVLLVDRPDEGGQLPDRVASSGVSEPHPVHPRPKLGGGSSSWGERDVTASRVRFAPGVAFSPLHYIS